MYSNIFDTHAHYDDPVFDGSLDELMNEQSRLGVVGIITNSSDIDSSHRAIELASRYSFVYAAVGVYPNEAAKVAPDWLLSLERLAAEKKVVAIGEIGLDYYYDDVQRDIQKEVFRKQILLANRLSLPIEVHDRDAHGDVLSILKELRPNGCLHRFSGSPEMAREVVKLGMFIGIGGALTYKNSKKERETVRQIPLESLVLETDCPYLAPSIYRGKPSTSDMISLVAEEISSIKGDVSAQEVLDATCLNAKRLFGIGR